MPNDQQQRPEQSSLIPFLGSWSTEILSKINRVRQLIGGANWGEEGSYKESLIRVFLKKILPKQYSVSTGFIVWLNKDISRQLDVIIWNNQRGVPLLEEGEFVILTPELVEGIVEIKTTIDATSLRKSLELLHMPEYFCWKYGRPAIDMGFTSPKIPGVPIRAILGFCCGIEGTRKSIAKMIFEQVSNFYRDLYKRDAFDMLSYRDSSLRYANLVDAICIVDTCEVEQAHIYFKQQDKPMADYPCLVVTCPPHLYHPM